MRLAKWLMFFVLCLASVWVAVAKSADYDYAGGVYNTITTNSACYSSKWWYDVDGEGPQILVNNNKP